VLKSVAVCCSVLQCVALCCSELQCNNYTVTLSKCTTTNSTEYDICMHTNYIKKKSYRKGKKSYIHTHQKKPYIVLQCIAVCCNVLQCCNGVEKCTVTPPTCADMLQCFAACCSVLQRVAACCSVLKCIAVCCSELKCAATSSEERELYIHTHCSVFQRVGVCCNVMQCHYVYRDTSKMRRRQ